MLDLINSIENEVVTMRHTRIESLIENAKSGNDYSRESLIRYYKSYILNTVASICNRRITWSDEEASIGLLAFNKAIDTYDKTKGRPFLDYVFLLIKRDLIDLFRKEKRPDELPMEVVEEDNHSENELAASSTEMGMEAYHESMLAAELAEEIIELDQALAAYQISFEELEDYSPKHRDTRNELLQMAQSFLKDDECVDQLLKKKRLPIKLFCKKTGYRPKTVERHRKYLITLIIIQLNQDWVQLKQFLQQASGNEGLL